MADDKTGPAADEPNRRLANGIAIASVICGLFFCVPIAGVLAIVFGVIGLKKTKDPHVGGKRAAIAGITLGCLGVLITPLVVSTLMVPLRLGARIASANNLKQIGAAINDYANGNMGRYPPDLGTLYRAQNMPVDTFIYPTVLPWERTSPPSNFLQISGEQQAQWINEHSDYVYLGAGFTNSADADLIAAYEKEGVPNPLGVNALFADGHVDELTKQEIPRLIQQQKSRGIPGARLTSSPTQLPRD